MMISLAENIEERENLKEFLEEAELQQYYELFRDILKVTKVSQLKFVLLEDLAQIGLSKPEQRRYKKIYSKYYPNTYISKIKKLLTASKKHDYHPQGPSSLPMDFQPFAENSVVVPTKHIISIEDITINKELGMGQFGVVQQGTWTTVNQRIQVAIKCLGHEQMTSNSTEFLKEAAVMHSIEHPNIVRLYGVVLHLDSLMLVTELAPLRSLLECLRELSLREYFPVTTLCEFAQQICDGMTYLENKRLIHRDLAARNILVFNKDKVKISDFGLSRALGVGKDYYQTNYNVNLKLPVAWCAPECILYLRFTSSSDVWAFAVTLWEMFTYGFQPWAGFSGLQILEAIDAPNYQRLERPECCPDEYYTTMLACWSHDKSHRPKFKELSLKLSEISPPQVQTTCNYQKIEEARRTHFLEYKSGQIITVLGKENMTKCAMWYGVLPGGACGLFDPNKTKPYTKPIRPSPPLGTLSPQLRTRSICTPSLLRSDVKRHTYHSGKKTIQRSMISSPQGEVKHTGHVGLDGAYFGDLSFLDPAGQPPRQVVTPYKPSEDLEQMPLINPNSPSHLMGGSSSAYPLLSNRHNKDCDEVDLPGDAKTKYVMKSILKSVPEPTTSRSILNRVKDATLGRTYKLEESANAGSKDDEAHEYHEISDTDTESNTLDNFRADCSKDVPPESPGIPKCYGDFSQSLLDEMESMFKSIESKRREENSKHEPELPPRSHTLSKLEKKRGFHTGTIKLMSAHDERTLDTAVALANEITTKSMNDMGTDSKQQNSPSERTSKFHFKLPKTLHHHAHNETDKDGNGKHERRNFSAEANSVPNIQETITEESKIAYTSLIEQPTPSSSLVSQINPDTAGLKPSTIPKANKNNHKSNKSEGKLFDSLPKAVFYTDRPTTSSVVQAVALEDDNLPLPSRASKPKLIEKRRHIRKYPLKMPYIEIQPKPIEEPQEAASSCVPKVYQNLNLPVCHQDGKDERKEDTAKSETGNNVVDVLDGPVDQVMIQTNPFTSISCSSNPFECYLVTTADDEKSAEEKEEEPKEENASFKEGSLVKDCTDHVSVEDLLEFADQKPCGRQRGVESDEVRIMCKVLKDQVTPDDCLESLELTDWNVHSAIKVIRVRLAANTTTLQQCSEQLLKANGDILKAASSLC